MRMLGLRRVHEWIWDGEMGKLGSDVGVGVLLFSVGAGGQILWAFTIIGEGKDTLEGLYKLWLLSM